MPWYWPFKRNDGTYTENRSSLIEGIDDDTLLIFFLMTCVIGLWIYYSRRYRSSTIHPENRQDVELLRQRSQEQGDTSNRTSSSSRSTGRSRQDTCPICLTEPPVLTVETNCGHLFCGKCIITFWKFQSNWMSGFKCPVCRQQVTVLLTCFTAEEQVSADRNDRQMIVNSVKDFNRRFSGAPRTWIEYFYDIPVLVPHVIRQIFTSESLAWTYRLRTIVLIISVIAYVISPFDILPESILGIFGLLDDFFIVLSSALYVVIAFRQNLAHGRLPRIIPLSHLKQDILFRPLLSTDEKYLTTFLESLSERTRHYCVYPSYDEKTAELFCNEQLNLTNNKLRLIALNEQNTIIALFNLTLSIRDDECERFYVNYKIKLNDKTTARLSPCITDNYQSKYLGSYLIRKIIDIARQMGKCQMILSGGVLVENTRAIHFFEKNSFKLFSTIFLSHDGYECRDGLIEIGL